MKRSFPLKVVFYYTATGAQPVREWLNSLENGARRRIGVDIWKAQSEWPIGMPHVRQLGEALSEIRANFPDGIARVIFTVRNDELILLHGFIKKTQKTPSEALDLAQKRKNEYEKIQEEKSRNQ